MAPLSKKRLFIDLEDDERGTERNPVPIDEHDDFSNDIMNLQPRARELMANEDNESSEDDDDAPLFIREINILEPALAFRAPLQTVIKSSKTGMTYKVGQIWEKDDGSFIKISRFVEGDDTVLAQGTVFQRTRCFQGRLQKKRNEVCMMVMLNSEGIEIESSFPLSSLYLPRQLIITNTPFPGFSWRGQQCQWQDAEDILERAVLVCRWKYIEQLDAGGKKVVKEGFVHVCEREADSGKSISDCKRLEDWHNSSAQDIKPYKRDESKIDLTGDDDKAEEVSETTYRRTNAAGTFIHDTANKVMKKFSPKPCHTNSICRKYTCGDICAGAGGMACGGVAAGLRYTFLLDIWDVACKTLRLNFDRSIEILQLDVFEFINLAKRHPGRYVVSILHLSLPCQYYALCHTVPGKNDERNIATNLCISEMLDCCRPRVVTLEQTPGILHKDGGVWLNVMIRQFTDRGYSVHWRVLNLAESGNSQARKRLIVIASAPGEDLPDFPQPTHGIGPLLKPFVTIHAALSKLMRPVFKGMEQYSVKNTAPYCPHKPLKSCITCNGGESDVHPSGKRSFMLAELALLQAFPPTHKFVGGKGDIRKQIGNAVPSCFSKTLYKTVIESLKRSDEKRQGTVANYEISLIE